MYVLAYAVLGDVWRPEERGRSLGIYALVPLLGAGMFDRVLEENLALTIFQLLVQS